MLALQPAVRRLIDENWTHAQIAQALGVSPQKWDAWKAGRESMPTQKLEMLAVLARIDPVQLVGTYAIERAKRKYGPVLPALVTATIALAGGDPNKPIPCSPGTCHSIHYAKLLQRLRKTSVGAKVAGVA